MTKILTLAIIALTLTTNLSAQVTIGSDNPPNSGALLDLKQETTTKKGLGMPRVNLTNLTPTTPAQLSASIGGAGNWDLDDHIGLIVYNSKDAVFDPATCKTTGAGPAGLYVWDGTKWQGIGIESGEDVRTVTDDGLKITLSYKGEVTEYHYSLFGAAGTWMTENLATQYLPDGTLIDKHTANSNTDPQYFIPGNNATITGKEGLLYNWAATMNRYICNTTAQGHAEAGNPIPGALEVESVEETIPGGKDGKIQGICPTGWHVPSDRELNQLEKEIATKASLYTQTPLANGTWTDSWETTAAGWRGTNQGTAMKSKDTYVNALDPQGDSKPAGSGGFDLLLTGDAYLGSVHQYGNFAYLWSSSSANSVSAWLRYMYSGNANASRYNFDRYGLFSVRCKKN